MTVSTEIEIDGIVFDCDWYADEDDRGDTWVELAAVSVGGQDLTGIISQEWWNKIEKELTKHLEDEREERKMEAELDRLEAWGI